jgi:hypothetical protein
MAREETLRNVPSERVGAVVQGFTSDGAREIRAARNAVGTWDITARFD